MSAFEDFIQLELPRRPWTFTDGAQETIPVRRGAGPRQMEFINITDGQVLGKISGTLQGVTISGLGGEIIPKNYIHTQGTAAATWTITHSKNSSDYVIIVVDQNGSLIIPNVVDDTSVNQVVIEFTTAQAGKAVLIFAS